MTKPKMIATYANGYVLLENVAFARDRTKEKQAFDAAALLLLGRGRAELRKRKGAKRYGRYLPTWKFQPLEKELRSLYELEVRVQDLIEFEEDFMSEVTGEWPDEEDMRPESSTEVEWWGDEDDPQSL